MLGLVDVLDPDQLDEVRVGVVVVEGDLRQAADGRGRIEVIELDVLLRQTNWASGTSTS